jgi:hypothetical protein
VGHAFALYSLMCKHAKVNFIPSQESEDPDIDTNHRHKLKQMIKNSNIVCLFLITMTIVGTSMVIGDKIFTPPMSHTTRCNNSFKILNYRNNPPSYKIFYNSYIQSHTLIKSK